MEEKIVNPNETDAVMMLARTKQVLGILATAGASVEIYRFADSGGVKDMLVGAALAGVAVASSHGSIRDRVNLYIEQRKEIGAQEARLTNQTATIVALQEENSELRSPDPNQQLFEAMMVTPDNT